nr:transposase [Gordonibacter urolithinfaciens]
MERTDSRNGYRERSLVASVGDLKVRMPKLRTGPSSPKTSSSATAGWTARSWPRRRRCTCSASQVARSRRWRARWTSPQYRSGRCRVWTNAWTWRREMFRRQRFDGAKFAYL